MASSPPFHVMEDQTDEDFFDKLVDDDVFRGPTSSDSASRFLEGSDSDEAKAFSNMSLEETRDEGYYEGNGKKDSVCSGSGLSAALAGGRNGNNNAMNSFTSAGSDAIIDSNNNDGDGSDVIMDPTTSKSSGSTKSGVKEVGWSSFYADSVPNSNHGYGSFSDFFNDLGGSSEDFPAKADESVNGDNRAVVGLDNSVNHDQYQDGTDLYRGSVSESVNEPAFSSSQNWENMYPGWKYDVNTGQWYQVDGYNATPSVQGSFDANAGNGWAATSDGKTEVNYLQHTSQTVVGTVAETSTTESVSSWNQVLQENNNGYPEHMVFDPQYPGWYYDTVAQEWCSLESYTSSTQSATVETHDRQKQSNGFDYSGSYSQNSTFMYGESGRNDLYGSQSYNSQGQLDNWSGYQQFKSSYDLNVSMNNHVNQHNSLNSLGKVPSHDNMGDGNAEANGFVGSRSLVSNDNFSQQFNHENATQNELMKTSSDYYGIQKPASVAQLSVYSNQQFSHGSDVGRSPIGRPPHALVTFGFGGKLIVMKDSRSLGNSSFSSQDPVGTSISVLSLMEVVSGSTENASSIGRGTCDFFHTLCHHSFPGPLVGGSVGSKELNKWIDERIANCESHDMDYRKSEALKLLLSLLKIACQHYGKFRSPFGTDSSLRESDAPESAVANLFASAKRNGTEFTEDGALNHCLRSLPSEGQIRASASEVQNLLVAGRKKEALQCAQEGQLWGPALVLASQLGEQFYVDTVKQMALRQLVAGSPLRTLCLLIAGQPADVFSTESMSHRGLPGAVNISQVQQPVQFGANGMLDDWEENLAVITANRTKDDELVIIHLGDCLWKDRSEITAAHICYLVAEANFESYSDSARLCLIGADHWKQPRTYVSPEAIQRTELYEYSKVLGNSQFILLPFQPYKLIYAHMLAEVGKVSDSLKYCQAVLKSLKTGRAPEVEMWKQLVLTLEERIRTHQQGGYTANLAPGKLVGKLLNFFDSTAHCVVGGLPPPVSSQSAGSVQSIENIHQAVAPRVLTSQSTMAMSSLMPSASMEPISEWAADNNRMAMHNRSVSEPDFGRTPRQVDSKEETSLSAQSKTSGSAGASRFGRFGFGSQLLQKTVGLVLGPRPGRQAKLGEKNKFYYDEKLKRWVEEGAEPPSEETALPPPPTTAAFQNGSPDYNIKSALKNDSSPTNGSSRYMSPSPPEQSSGIPPIPTSSNQFSARGRMGVRSRYVDTFNQGNVSSAKLFQSPSVPSVKSAVASNAKFFIPAPAPSNEYSMEAVADNAQDISETAENPSTSVMNESFTSSSSMNMQRYPSMDHIARKQAAMNGGGPVSSHSRRTASWNGSFGDSIRPAEPKPLGEVLGMPPSSFMPSHPPMTHMPTNGGSIGEDLHEVEL